MPWAMPCQPEPATLAIGNGKDRFIMGGNQTIGASILALTLTASAIAAKVETKPVTFAKDVAPILQAKCEDCHRKGAAAPLSLVTYQEPRPWSTATKERRVTPQMPPRHTDNTGGIQHVSSDPSM